MRRLRPAALALVLLAGCFGPNPNVTESGKGKPLLSVEFPDTAAPGSVETATMTVENPGPGDIRTLAIAFASVGVAGASGPLPADLVPLTTTSDNPAVVSITPEPQEVSADGVVYYFGPLPEGETTEIEFRIRVPESPGPAANSVTAYAGEETDRIRGLRLDTMVTG
ncbi:MAG TPA: hypothetical protein VHN37_16085 [Actinomycetota bacterium]|nr:hypothetical protein [Actinomycetota bacterium]